MLRVVLNFRSVSITIVATITEPCSRYYGGLVNGLGI